jgi:hypothetical protein
VGGPVAIQHICAGTQEACFSQHCAAQNLYSRSWAPRCKLHMPLLMARLCSWESRISEVTNPSIVYPSYYTQPFHAYTQGCVMFRQQLALGTRASAPQVLVMQVPEIELQSLSPTAVNNSRTIFQGISSLSTTYLCP